jgi:hypothetical protein
MRVRARKIQANETPPSMQAFLGDNQTFVTERNEYDVYAMSWFDGVIFLQIVNDVRLPAWVPFILFEVIDGTMPNDWKCNLFPQNAASGLGMLIGPAFIVRDEQSYQEMVELNSEQVSRFWKRYEASQQAESPSIL